MDRPEQGDDLEAMALAGAIPSGSGRLGFIARRALVGPVLRSAAVAEERMRKLVALPVLSSEAAWSCTGAGTESGTGARPC